MTAVGPVRRVHTGHFTTCQCVACVPPRLRPGTPCLLCREQPGVTVPKGAPGAVCHGCAQNIPHELLDDGDDVEGLHLPLAVVLAHYVPGSQPQPWTWDDEAHDLLARECLCCGQPGHYQRQLEHHLARHGLTQGVCLGDDGRVWDGHHRIVAARHVGIEAIPIESAEDAEQRWLRDHGPVSWEQRRFGDTPTPNIPHNLTEEANP